MLLAMNRHLRRTQGWLAIGFALALAIGPELAEAQDAGGTPPVAPAAPQSPAPPTATEPPPAPAAGQAEQPAPQADRFSQDELRKLLAPIALFPDALLAQLLPASAYPVEIVQAERWLDKHPDLVAKNDFSGIDSQKWDPAVKAMARFPDILRKMSQNLSSTTDLGDAMVNQPQDVASVIQELRTEAEKSGALTSNAQQTVKRVGSSAPPSGGGGGGGVVAPQGSGEFISIQPTDPSMLYVPSYDPYAVWSGAPVVAPLLTFGTGVALGALATGAWWNWGSGAVYPGWGGAYGGYAGWSGARVNNGNINVGNNVNIGNGNRQWSPNGNYRPGQGSKPGIGNRPGGAGRPGRPGGIGGAGAPAALEAPDALAASAARAGLGAGRPAALEEPGARRHRRAGRDWGRGAPGGVGGPGGIGGRDALAGSAGRAALEARAALAAQAALAIDPAIGRGPATAQEGGIVQAQAVPHIPEARGRRLVRRGPAGRRVRRAPGGYGGGSFGGHRPGGYGGGFGGGGMRGGGAAAVIAAASAAGIEAAADIEAAAGVAAEAAVDVPISGSSTIWFCSDGSTTASAIIASSTMAATRPMSA